MRVDAPSAGPAKGKSVRLVAVFALLGPIVGTAVIVGGTILTVLGNAAGAGPSFPAAVAGFLLFAVIALGVGLVLGVIPATITGVICLILSRHLPSTALWMGLSALVGATVTAMFTVVMRSLILSGAGRADGIASIAALSMPAGLAITGGLAALTCAALSRTWRPRHA